MKLLSKNRLMLVWSASSIYTKLWEVQATRLQHVETTCGNYIGVHKKLRDKIYVSSATPLPYTTFQATFCCRKTAVCNGDQLLDFSVPEFVRSQSTLSTDPEALQNCAGFNIVQFNGLAAGECSAVMSLTPRMLCVQIYFVLCVLD